MAALGEEGSGKREAEGREPLPPSRVPLSRRLLERAEELLAQVQSGPPSRDSALTILTADALITLAVEAEAASRI